MLEAKKRATTNNDEASQDERCSDSIEKDGPPMVGAKACMMTVPSIVGREHSIGHG